MNFLDETIPDDKAFSYIPKSKKLFPSSAVQFDWRTVRLLLDQFSKAGKYWLPQYKKFVLQSLCLLQLLCQHVSLRSSARKYQKAPTICKTCSNIPSKWTISHLELHWIQLKGAWKPRYEKKKLSFFDFLQTCGSFETGYNAI